MRDSPLHKLKPFDDAMHLNIPDGRVDKGKDHPKSDRHLFPVFGHNLPFSVIGEHPYSSFCRSILHRGPHVNGFPRGLNGLFDNGKQKVEAQGGEPKGLGFATCFNRAGLMVASNGNDITHIPFRNNPLPKLPVRVSPFSQRWHVSGGTSPRKRASDPSKRCTRLWTHLTALYGAYGLCVTDARNRLTGRLAPDTGHGQVYGDLILCSPTAWCSSGYRELRKADYCQKHVNGSRAEVITNG